MTASAFTGGGAAAAKASTSEQAAAPKRSSWASVRSAPDRPSSVRRHVRAAARAATLVSGGQGESVTAIAAGFLSRASTRESAYEGFRTMPTPTRSAASITRSPLPSRRSLIARNSIDSPSALPLRTSSSATSAAGKRRHVCLQYDRAVLFAQLESTVRKPSDGAHDVVMQVQVNGIGEPQGGRLEPLLVRRRDIAVAHDRAADPAAFDADLRSGSAFDLVHVASRGGSPPAGRRG